MAIAYVLQLPERVTAGIMAFGCGVLISAVAYDLLEDGFAEGGIWPIAAGAVVGSFAYAIADWLVSRYGGHHRKRSGDQQQKSTEGGGLAIAIGSLLDGVPESVVLGLGLLAGQGIKHGNAGRNIPFKSARGTVECTRNEAGGQKQDLRLWHLDQYRGPFGAGFTPWSRAAWWRIATSIGGGERGGGWRSPDDDREHDDPRGG